MDTTDHGSARRIYATGECIFDIAFKDHEIIFARPGGSKLNSAVSLGRLGIPVSLISECSHDPVGRFIRTFLESNHIATDQVASFEGQVRLAFAFLDEQNDASYTFYPGAYRESVIHPEPDFGPDDILLFGSFYALKTENRSRIRHLIRRARDAGNMIFYDPNFRTPHLKDLGQVWPAILENIQYSDIIRGSDEDFGNIFQMKHPDRIYDKISGAGGRILILTQGPQEVVLFTENLKKSYPVRTIHTISTIGAGDTFNAGILYELFKQGIVRADLTHLTEKQWDALIQTAISFASHVCSQSESYVSWSFARDKAVGSWQ